MDIRNFFSKKGGGGSGASSKQKTVTSLSGSADKNASIHQEQKGIVKPAVGDDDDDIIMIENSLENKSNASVHADEKKRKNAPHNGPKVIKNTETEKSTNVDATSKNSSKTDPTLEERDIFLDDTDDDDDYIQPVPSRSKKLRTVETQVLPKVNPALESPSLLRSSPRARKAPPISISNPTQSTVVKKPPSSSKPSAQKITALPVTVSQDQFNVNSATSQCLLGCTFCFSGVLPDLSRDEAVEMVKILGGRVTTTVSGKTTYLVIGDLLEDGRPVEEGSKYKRATSPESPTILVRGTNFFYGLLQQYSDQGAKNNVTLNHDSGSSSLEINKPASSETMVPVHDPSSSKPLATVTTANLYKNVAAASSNPYARKSNPYAKKPASTNALEKSDVALVSQRNVLSDRKMPAVERLDTKSNDSELWVDKYKPKHSSEILGNQEAVRKLTVWLASWEECFNSSHNKIKSFSSPNGPWKAALLSGPPGIGKTTTATLVALEAGRDVLEFNASDVRSKKAIQEEMGDITGSHTLEFRGVSSRKQSRTKRCIIMDEVDGMGAGDRSGMAELIQMIKTSRVPIVCICNDRQSQKMKSLLPYCMDLRYRRPTKSVIASRAVQIARLEGLVVEPNAAEAIVESCGNDVRQVLNCLQMWSSSPGSHASNTMTYKDLKDRESSINKDEILRVSLFDAARLVVEGRKGLTGADAMTQRNHFFRRNDAYFVDYNFLGLLVQQNYLKVMQPQFNEIKRHNDSRQMLSILERMHQASHSLSDWAVVDESLHGDMNWSLLPVTAALAVKTGYHAGGESGGLLAGFPEFTTWLGRNSTRNKKVRILKELGHHMNYKISAGTTEMRMSYLPLLRARFLSLLTGDNPHFVEEAIELMDGYGLDRDDVFEKLDEFNFDAGKETSGSSFQKIDSKKKASFTRLYNQGAHKSQALVAEQGAIKKSKRAASAATISELGDPEAIDDDMIPSEEVDDDNDNDDEQDIEKIRAAFQKKGGRGGNKKAAAARPRASKKKN